MNPGERPYFQNVPREWVRLAPDGTHWERYNPLVRAWLDAAIYPSVSRKGRARSGASRRAARREEAVAEDS